MAILNNGQLAKCPRCGMNMMLYSNSNFYCCTWFFCESRSIPLSEADILSRPVLTQAQKNAYATMRTSYYQQVPIYQRRTSMKEVRITYLYNNTIVELHFITMPRKGWFKDSTNLGSIHKVGNNIKNAKML